MSATAKIEEVRVVANAALGADLVGSGEWPFGLAARANQFGVMFELHATTEDASCRQVLATTEISAELVARATTAQLSAFVARALLDPAGHLLLAYRAGEAARYGEADAEEESD